MSDRSHIQWTDATWNPVTGCDRVSPGCDHCYIDRTPSFRIAGRRFDDRGRMGVQLHPERLDQPLRWRKSRRVFVNSLSDLFHKDIPDEFIVEVWNVMGATSQHTYQVLTKRPERMRQWMERAAAPEYVNADGLLDIFFQEPDDVILSRLEPDRFTWPLPNIWLGVSVENQRYTDLRIPHLLATPAAVRFLSCEPLLGPVDLDAVYPGTVHSTDYVGHLDWCIVGGESGPGARPMDLAWARSLVEQCRAAGVPVFVKQLGAVWARQAGARHRAGGDMDEWPEDLRVREMPA